MKANEIQIGGAHYKKGESLQHWDLIETYGIGYVEGCSTKYVYRFQDKAGLQDLQKGDHYLIKLLELNDEIGRQPRGRVPDDALEAFCLENQLCPLQTEFMRLVLQWEDVEHILMARNILQRLITQHYPNA